MDSSSSVHGVKSNSPVGPGQNNLRNILAGSHYVASLAAESQFVVNSVLEVLSISLLLLCTRTLHEAKPVSDMLQVLGILAQADNMKILQRFDETIWRTLLVACANTGGDVMRKVACVIFDTLTACGITPDALTYGSYTRALAATKYSNQNSTNGQQIDQFLFLEEIGLAWFQQRSAVIEQTQSDLLVPDTRGAAPKGGMLSTMFTRKKRPSALMTRRRVSNRSGNVCEMTGAGDSAMTTAAQLGLIRPPAALCLLCPPGPFILTPPRFTHSFPFTETTQELSSELSARIGKLMLDYKPPSPPARLNIRRASLPSNGRATTNIDISMFSSPNKIGPRDDVLKEDSSNNFNEPSDASKDLFGPGTVAVSTDSLDSSLQKKTGSNDDNESKASAYVSSSLGAAVSSSSSAAASTVKHFGSMMIAGIPIPNTLRQNNAVPVETLQDMVRSNGVCAPLSLSQPANDVEPAHSSPTSRAMSRMASINRLTQSVFVNPFLTSKEKEKEKEKEKPSLDNMFSISPRPQTPTGHPPLPPPSPPLDGLSLAVKTAAARIIPNTNSFYNKEAASDEDEDEGEEKGSERKVSLLSIRFSDDEADDSEEEGGALSRRSSSTSIRMRDRDSKSSKKQLSFSSEAGKVSTVATEAGSPSRSGLSPKQNTMTSVETFAQSMSGSSCESPIMEMASEDHKSLPSDIDNNLLQEATSLCLHSNNEEEEKKDAKNADSFQELSGSSSGNGDENINAPVIIGNGEISAVIENITVSANILTNSSPETIRSNDSYMKENITDRNEDDKGSNPPSMEVSPVIAIKKINKPPKPIPIQIPKLPLPANTSPIGNLGPPPKKAPKPIPTQAEIDSKRLARASTDTTTVGASAPKPIPSNSNALSPQHPPLIIDPAFKSLQTPPRTPAASLSSKRVNVLAMQTDVNSIFSNAFVREGSAIGIHCATPCPICNHTLLDEEVRTYVSRSPFNTISFNFLIVFVTIARHQSL